IPGQVVFTADPGSQQTSDAAESAPGCFLKRLAAVRTGRNFWSSRLHFLPLLLLFLLLMFFFFGTLPLTRDTNNAVPHPPPRLRGPCRGLLPGELPDNACAIGLARDAK